jgi:hypothetical protein
LKEPGSVRIEATSAPPRRGAVSFGAVPEVEAVGWLDRHPAANAAAAKTATIAALVTKRFRTPDCPVKNCLVGQEIGRSAFSVQRQHRLTFFVQSDAAHKIDTPSANFLAWLCVHRCSGRLARSKSNP